MTQDYKGFKVHDDVDLGNEGSPEELAALERWRGNHELTPEERRHLDAWTTRKNLDRVIEFLDGTHPTAYFGNDATLDQVHGQTWHPDVCEDMHLGKGCAVHQVWDHRLRETPEEIVHHPHRQHQVCARHAHLTGQHREHHETLLAECRHKEKVLGKIIDTHGLTVHDRPKWYYDKDHTLVIDTTDHPVLQPRHVRGVVIDYFSDAAIKVI